MSRPTSWCHKRFPEGPYGADFRPGGLVELGEARVSTAKQDLDRQVDPLAATGIPAERV